MKVNTNKIKLLLVENNMNQKDLAERAGISEVTLSSFMNGKNASKGSLNKLAKTFNVPVRDIVAMK